MVISQCRCISQHQVIRLKYIQLLFVNYTSTNMRKATTVEATLGPKNRASVLPGPHGPLHHSVHPLHAASLEQARVPKGPHRLLTCPPQLLRLQPRIILGSTGPPFPPAYPPGSTATSPSLAQWASTLPGRLLLKHQQGGLRKGQPSGERLAAACLFIGTLSGLGCLFASIEGLNNKYHLPVAGRCLH